MTLQDGERATHYAARKGQKMVLHKLIIAGAHVNAQNEVSYICLLHYKFINRCVFNNHWLDRVLFFL